MQWGHIKTLFIICFLILDIFLVKEIIEKKTDANLSALASTSQDRLETLRSNYEGVDENLSEESVTGSYLTMHPQQFTEADLSVFTADENQEIELVSDQSMLLSVLEEPAAVPVEGEKQQIETAVKEVALLAKNYTFWVHEETTNTLVFFQKSGEYPIYYNQSGLLLVFLNEENEITQYIQTEMAEIEEEQEEKALINSVNAASYLSNEANELLIGDEFSDATLGYHTLISNPDGIQVFVPSWRILINETRNYLVNAIEGGSLPQDNTAFLQETLTDYSLALSSIERSESLVDQVKNRIDIILATTMWSEENGD